VYSDEPHAAREKQRESVNSLLKVRRWEERASFVKRTVGRDTYLISSVLPARMMVERFAWYLQGKALFGIVR